eukprot:3869815-Pyramimonas_sp.AAC.1
MKRMCVQTSSDAEYQMWTEGGLKARTRLRETRAGVLIRRRGSPRKHPAGCWHESRQPSGRR